MAHMTWVGDSTLLCSCQGPHSSKTSPVVFPSHCPQALELPQSLPGQDHGHGPHWSRAWPMGWWPWPHFVTTNLLRGHDPSCTHWVWSWPAERLPAWPWICLFTTNLSNCLNSWLSIICCLWSCPASSLGQPGPCPGDTALGSVFPVRAAALAASWQ